MINLDSSNIKALEIGFENCLVTTVPAEYVTGYISKESSTIAIHKSFNDFKIQDEGFGDYYLFDRIQCHDDITSLTVVYTDGTEDMIYVEYKEKDEDVLGSPNVFQKSKIDEYGNLIVTIGEEV